MKKPQSQNVPRNITSQGLNVPGKKRPREKTSQGKKVPKDKTSQGTKRPKGTNEVHYLFLKHSSADKLDSWQSPNLGHHSSGYLSAMLTCWYLWKRYAAANTVQNRWRLVKMDLFLKARCSCLAIGDGDKAYGPLIFKFKISNNLPFPICIKPVFPARAFCFERHFSLGRT